VCFERSDMGLPSHVRQADNRGAYRRLSVFRALLVAPLLQLALEQRVYCLQSPIEGRLLRSIFGSVSHLFPFDFSPVRQSAQCSMNFR
jgi:hypothetical protein